MPFVSFPNTKVVKPAAPLKAKNPVSFMYRLIRDSTLSADYSPSGWQKCPAVTILIESRVQARAAYQLLCEVFEGVEMWG